MNYKKLTIIFLIPLVIAAGYFVYLKSHARSRYIFINHTDDHRHDLALQMSLKLAESRSGIENSLILLKELPGGISIEEAAHRIFQRLRIGQARRGKGILLLYSQKENLFKVEVSYALEGTFPDIVCRQLEQAAQSYMLSDVPQDFLSELLITMNIDAKAANADPESAGSISAPEWMKDAFLSGGAGVRAQGYRRTLDQYKAVIRRLPEAQTQFFMPSTDPDETVRRYLKSLEKGIGDPQLPLLTEGSQIFRLVVPRNAAHQRRVLRYYNQATPYEIFTRPPLALAVFRAGVPNLPIVLRRMSDGLWYVDEAKSWTYFHRFEDGNNFFIKYADLPFLPELVEMKHPNASNPLYGHRVSTPPVSVEPGALAAQVAEYERKIEKDPGNAKLYAELGEIYLFEMDWITKTLGLFEKASQLDPANLQYRWRLFDLYVNNSEAEKALAQLKYLSETSPKDPMAVSWYDFYSKIYKMKPGEFRSYRIDEIL